jgi:hypothetical protein
MMLMRRLEMVLPTLFLSVIVALGLVVYIVVGLSHH